MTKIELQGDTAADRNSWLRQLLSRGVYDVTFTKVNGELRTMPCTLDPMLLPPEPLREYHQTRLFKPETMSVWCLDKMEWRSFRVANVQRIVRTQ